MYYVFQILLIYLMWYNCTSLIYVPIVNIKRQLILSKSELYFNRKYDKNVETNVKTN